VVCHEPRENFVLLRGRVNISLLAGAEFNILSDFSNGIYFESDSVKNVVKMKEEGIYHPDNMMPEGTIDEGFK